MAHKVCDCGAPLLLRRMEIYDEVEIESGEVVSYHIPDDSALIWLVCEKGHDRTVELAERQTFLMDARRGL